MVHPHLQQDHAQQPADADARRLESRRRMLRRSLGTAAPVVLTLSSMPVAAGQCISASAFVSSATFQSRQARLSSEPCLGLSPTEWVQKLPYWPGGLKPTRKFHQEFGEHILSAEFDHGKGSVTLLDVLNAPNTIEAHVTAALLNAYRGQMTQPFDSPAAVIAIWHNIRANGGFYKSPTASAEQPAMTPLGTRLWIARTWDGSGPTSSPMSSPSSLPGYGPLTDTP
ncbi:hypothetical protein [uncultured Azohydromonas sp.]|jgi:hypothetical protein|uniref:hypothetical protein n=1 Tax=uncultured Azohydromonas sp. TaxID=487342 RepID=UPI002611BF79|nr:hypothetical protein [uncultured Azohydromonas sp.]